MSKSDTIVGTVAQKPRALVVGASGISGRAVSAELAKQGWDVYGLSRTPGAQDGVTPIRADLLDPDSLKGIAAIRPQAVFVTTWIKRKSEAENIEANGMAMTNLVDAFGPIGTVRHVSLMTGLKHYLGPFESFATSVSADTPFREDEPRTPTPNFYYAQEDAMFAGSEKFGYSWSSHRAHTVIGFAVGNAMNMALTLGAYAAICKETDTPFVFPGSEAQWNGITDVTDVELLAEQMVWAASSPSAANTAFNITNGDVFRWRWLWPRLAAYFGIPWEAFSEQPRPLEPRMSTAGETWRKVVEKHGLVEPNIENVASWWHSDNDLGRPIECFADMRRSRERGFMNTRSTEQSFIDAFERYRAARLLPSD